MIQYIIHLTYLERISDQSDSNLFLGYSLLDILGLDSLEAVVGGVEGGQEKPHKWVDRPRHLGKGLVLSNEMQNEYHVIHKMWVWNQVGMRLDLQVSWGINNTLCRQVPRLPASGLVKLTTLYGANIKAERLVSAMFIQRSSNTIWGSCGLSISCVYKHPAPFPPRS